MPLEIWYSNQWKFVNVQNSFCYGTSWNSRHRGNVFVRLKPLSHIGTLSARITHEGGNKYEISCLEYKFCFHQCEQTPECKAFDIATKMWKNTKTYKTVECGLKRTGSDGIEEVNLNEYLTSAVGYMNCGE